MHAYKCCVTCALSKQEASQILVYQGLHTLNSEVTLNLAASRLYSCLHLDQLPSIYLLRHNKMSSPLDYLLFVDCCIYQGEWEVLYFLINPKFFN